jgi:serine phosphatase RsbU (regulator of sigma subunit)
MDFAREVQARLFPQTKPTLRTLDYTGTCIQARQVGGDYYDFLALSPERVVFVIADVSGKGVSAALMMANLQANLRSQYAVALNDVGALLASVNRLFYSNSSESVYATLFLGVYSDSTRRLCYVNCGHLPPLLLRFSQQPDGGCVEELESTSTVLGLFERWDCQSAEIELFPGDVLVMYTDGVTEAEGPEGEQFGVSRLAKTIKDHKTLPVSALQQAIINAVQTFSAAEHQDDITLVIAQCKAS